MLFNVSGLIQEGIGATRQYQVDSVLQSGEREPEPVSGNVEFVRTKAGILVRAQLVVEEKETCSRCLAPLHGLSKIDFEEEFQATVEPGGQVLREGYDQDAFLIDENHLLDLTEAVRQYREASAEIQPLCRADCRGLCPRCGQDLNTGQCSCDAAPVDARWAALSRLLPDTEGKE